MYQFDTMFFGVNISTDGLQESFLSFLRPSQGLTGSYTGFFFHGSYKVDVRIVVLESKVGGLFIRVLYVWPRCCCAMFPCSASLLVWRSVPNHEWTATFGWVWRWFETGDHLIYIIYLTYNINYIYIFNYIYYIIFYTIFNYIYNIYYPIYICIDMYICIGHTPNPGCNRHHQDDLTQLNLQTCGILGPLKATRQACHISTELQSVGGFAVAIYRLPRGRTHVTQHKEHHKLTRETVWSSVSQMWNYKQLDNSAQHYHLVFCI